MLKMTSQLKRYLFWFAHEHVDFRLPEIQSIFDMYNVTPQIIIRPKEHVRKYEHY